MSNATYVPPGWYPDPSGAPQARWWDGTQWQAATQQVATPYGTTPPPTDVDTNTVHIWILVVLPLLQSIPIAFFDWEAYLRASMEPAQSIDMILTPGYLSLLAASWGGWALTALFAFLDWRALKQRIDRPFHFAWVFLYSPVYMIGRPVVARSRAGGSLAPIWAWIASVVLGTVIVCVSMFSQLTSILSTHGG